MKGYIMNIVYDDDWGMCISLDFDLSDMSDKELFAKVKMSFKELEQYWFSLWEITPKEYCSDYVNCQLKAEGIKKEILLRESIIKNALDVLSSRHLQSRWYHRIVKDYMKLEKVYHDKGVSCDYFIKCPNRVFVFTNPNMRKSRFYYCLIDMVNGLNGELSRHSFTELEGVDFYILDYDFKIHFER